MAAAQTVPNRRWAIDVLLGTGVPVNYFDRISLSVAAPQLQHDLSLTPGERELLFGGRRPGRVLATENWRK